MKKIFPLLLFVVISFCSFGQVWTEDFEAEADGASTGTGNPPATGSWNTTCVGCATAASLNNVSVFEVSGGAFVAGRFQVLGGGTDGMEAEGVWTSPSISITGFTDVSVYIETASLLTEGGDYLNVYYQLDVGSGFGAETLFHSQATGTGTSYGISSKLNGINLRIVVRAFTSDKNDGFSFDNIAVTNTLFSAVASGNYGTAGTWSSLGIDQAVCGSCVPNNFTHVVIGGDDVITITGAAQAASVTVHGSADPLGAGTLTYSGNFALEIDLAGPIVINNGGQITAGGNAGSSITFLDDLDHSITNNGSLNIGDITITSSFFDDGANITLSGSGSTTLLDDLTITGSLLGASSLTTNSTGNLTVGGSTTLTSGEFTDSDNTGVTTFVGSYSQTDFNSAFNSTSITTASNLVFSGGITQNGGTFAAGGATFNTNSQAIAGNSDMSFADFVVVTGVTVTNNNTGDVSFTRTTGGITLDGTGTWTQGANSTLNYTGSSIGVAIFNASAAGNTVTYNSTSSTQAVRIPNSASTYTNLTLNNSFATSPQFTISGGLTVSGVLNMSDGNVNLNANTISLTSTGSTALTHALTSAAGWMYGGTITRSFQAGTVTIGTERGLIPIGTSTQYRPFFFSKDNVGGSTGTISLTHSDPGTTTTGLSIADSGPVTIIIRNNSAWASTLTGGTGATFRIRYGGTGMGDVTNLTHLRSMLVNSVIGTTQATTGSFTEPLVDRSALTVAQMSNTFYMGSTNNASPLPIELVDFIAVQKDDKVELTWLTASELNNDYFTIERLNEKSDIFEVITKPITGKGTTNESNTYSALDASPLFGKNYYRLKQTDFDGQFSYSDVVMVEFTGPTVPLSIYPNPLYREPLTIEIRNAGNENTIPIQIMNARGFEVYRVNYKINGGGTLSATIDASVLQSGIYYVRAGEYTQKLVVQ